jgi:hypothetical protein
MNTLIFKKIGKKIRFTKKISPKRISVLII